MRDCTCACRTCREIPPGFSRPERPVHQPPYAMLLWIVVGGILIVVVILVFDAAGRFIASQTPGCRLHKSILLQDACVGGCPPGTRCVALTTRPYFYFGTQAASCGCAAASAGGTSVSPPPGGVTPPPGGGAAPPVEPQ